MEEVALGDGPHLPLCPTAWAHSPKSSPPFLLFRKSQAPDKLQDSVEPTGGVPSLPPSSCACPSGPPGTHILCPPARDVGGGWGGTSVRMKGPFSSTAGRTAATKARLDTLCPESPLQLASPPGTPLFLTLLSFPSMPGSRQGPAVGKGSLSQQPEGSDRSAEGPGTLHPLSKSCPPFPRPRGAVGGGIAGQRGACPPLPSGGVAKGRGTGGHRDAGQIAHPGGPEYALHSADGAQPGGNDPHPTPSAPLWQASQPQCLPCPTLLGLSGEGRPAQSGRGTGGSVAPALGAVWIRLRFANQSVLWTTGSCLHTCCGSSVGGCRCVFWGLALSGMGRKEFSVIEVCRKDMAFLEKGKEPWGRM